MPGGEASAGNFSRIFASPILRAQQTAEIISSSLGLEVVHDERLRELGLGPYSGKPIGEYDGARPSMRDWISGAKTTANTESYADLKKRTSEFLDELVRAHALLEPLGLLLVDAEQAGELHHEVGEAPGVVIEHGDVAARHVGDLLIHRLFARASLD